MDCGQYSASLLDTDSQSTPTGKCCRCGETVFEQYSFFTVEYEEYECPGCFHRMRHRVFEMSINFRGCEACRHACFVCSDTPPKDVVITVTCNTCQLTVSNKFTLDIQEFPKWKKAGAIIFAGHGETTRCGKCQHIPVSWTPDLYNDGTIPLPPPYLTIGDEDFDFPVPEVREWNEWNWTLDPLPMVMMQ